MTTRRRPAWALAAALVAVASVQACGGGSSPTQPSTSTDVIPANELAEMLSEKVMGSAAAGVSIIEYSSFTCPHCAAFHATTLPRIKAAYIDTGKVKLVYRDFPVNGASTQAAAYTAAALARCAGNARYFEALDLLYRGQSSWTSAGNAVSAMKQVLAPIGVSSARLDACAASVEIQNEITRQRTDGINTHGVGGTPTFIIGGQKIVGDAEFAAFDAVLRPLVQ